MYKLLNILSSYLELILIKLKINSNEELERRLSICSTCELNKRFTCGVCGCVKIAKASGIYNKCPHPKGNKWEAQD
jgi:hypothetical protein